MNGIYDVSGYLLMGSQPPLVLIGDPSGLNKVSITNLDVNDSDVIIEASLGNQFHWGNGYLEIDTSLGITDVSLGTQFYWDNGLLNVDASIPDGATRTYVDGSLALRDALISINEGEINVLDAAVGGHETRLDIIDVSITGVDASITWLFENVEPADKAYIDGSLGLRDASLEKYGLVIDNIDSSIDALDTLTQNLETSVGALDTLTQTHTTEITDLETSVGALDTLTQNIETSVGALDTLTVNLDSSIGDLDTLTQTHTTEISNLETSVGALDILTQNLEASIATIDTSVDIGPLEASVAALDILTQNIETSIGALDTLTVNLDSSIGDLDTLTVNLESSIGDLDTLTQTHTTEITNLETSAGTLDTLTQNLDTSIGALDTLTQNLDTSIATLDTLTVNLESSVGALDTLTQNLDTSIGDLDTQIQINTADISCLDVSISTEFLSYDEANWVNGNVIYVPIDGDIQTYVDNASPGDTLVLASGTYYITSDISIGKELNLRGQGNAGFLHLPPTFGHGTLIESSTNGLTAFILNEDNIRISNLSINLKGNNSIAMQTINNLEGLVWQSIDVIVNCSGPARGFNIIGSDMVMRDLTFDIFSSDNLASGVWFSNNASTTEEKIIDCFSVTGTVEGRATYAVAFIAENTNCDSSLYLNLSNSVCRANAGTPLDVATATLSTTTNNAVVNCYMCTLDGNDYDVYNTSTNTLNVGGSVLENNLIFGNINYRAAMASAIGIFSNRVETPVIKSLVPPVDSSDAANKWYVDTSLALCAPLYSTISVKSSDYTVTAADNQAIIECDASMTLTFPDDIDEGFKVDVVSTTINWITLDASTLLTVDSSVDLRRDGDSAIVYSKGSGVWRAYGALGG